MKPSVYYVAAYSLCDSCGADPQKEIGHRWKTERDDPEYPGFTIVLCKECEGLEKIISDDMIKYRRRKMGEGKRS